MQASTINVPSGSVFLVKPISFSGPNCEPNIVFQVSFRILNPHHVASYHKIKGSSSIPVSLAIILLMYIHVWSNVMQLDGKIIAPTSSGDWGSGLLQWLEFTKLKGISIKGKGVIDGQGSVWWSDSPTYNIPADQTYSSSQDTVINYSSILCQAKTQPANVFIMLKKTSSSLLISSETN